MFLRRQGQSQSRAATTASGIATMLHIAKIVAIGDFAYDRWLHWHRRYRIAGTSRRARCQTAKVRENYDLRDATRILIATRAEFRLTHHPHLAPYVVAIVEAGNS
jgi:hypothetical protein